MRAIANNNPEGAVIASQIEAFLLAGGVVKTIPNGLGSETLQDFTQAQARGMTADGKKIRAMTEFENRQAIKKSTGDFFVAGVFNPNSAASKKAYSRGGKA